MLDQPFKPTGDQEYLCIYDLIFKGTLSFHFFVGIHLIAILSVFYVPCSRESLYLCLGFYFIRMFAITAGYHRYFSHRSFCTTRIFQFILAFVATTSLQKGPLWWAAQHRHHHKYADKEDDVHSPTLKGFLWSHIGWFLLSSKHYETKWKYIPDLVKFPELLFLNKYHQIPGVLVGTTVAYLLGFESFIWGFLISTVLLWHGTFFINSLAHVFGSRRYATQDTSKNNLILSLITLGEGWHNNHHTFKSSAKQGFYWYEVDVTYYILQLLSTIRIVWGLRMPPLDSLHNFEISKLGDPFMETIKKQKTEK